MMDWFKQVLQSVREGEEGQGLVEYALILSLVAIASIVVLGLLGADIDGVFEEIRDAFTDG
jgi:pilus assembly protein Flp/PilA